MNSSKSSILGHFLKNQISLPISSINTVFAQVTAWGAHLILGFSHLTMRSDRFVFRCLNSKLLSNQENEVI